MFGTLQNLWLQVKSIRDMIAAHGPEYAADLATVLRKVATVTDQVGVYLGALGPLVLAEPGKGDLSSAEAQGYLKDLATWKGEFEALAGQYQQEHEANFAKHQQELDVGVQAGLLGNLLGKIDPATKTAILNLLSGLLSKVLLKSGTSAAALFPQFGQKRAASAPKK